MTPSQEEGIFLLGKGDFHGDLPRSYLRFSDADAKTLLEDYLYKESKYHR